MDTTSPSLDTMLKMHMKYQTERQRVLAQNISNIDTPQYKAQDLKKLDFKKMMGASSGRLEMRATSPKHLPGTLGGATSFAASNASDAFETSPTKNNVVLEDQMAKVSDTGAQFQLSSNMLRKFTQLYRTAAGNK
ncbi:MAG: flagellar basal body rod protein FlgB [Pseudomonadota bacterium]